MAQVGKDERLQSRREPTLDGIGRELNEVPDHGWFYAIDGTETGPVSKGELLTAVKAMPAMAEVVVWHPSLTDWILLQQSGLLRDQPRPPVPADANSSPQGFNATLFSLHGRMPRLKFLSWSFALTAVYTAVIGAVLVAAHLELNGTDAVALRVGLALPFFWSLLALTSKRLHDLDLSAKHLFWVMPVILVTNLPASPAARVIPLVASAVVELWLLCKRGTAGPNNYGPDPFNRSLPSVRSAGMAEAVTTSKKRSGWWGIAALVTAAAIALFIFVSIDSRVPSCSDQGVVEKVRQIVAESSGADASVFLSGGADNVAFSIRGVRTLSNDEPLNGRTCVASVVVNALKPGLLGKGELGSEEVTFTVQNTDSQDGHYVVTVRR